MGYLEPVLVMEVLEIKVDEAWFRGYSGVLFSKVATSFFVYINTMFLKTPYYVNSHDLSILSKTAR